MTIKESDDLNLPDAPDFISETPAYSSLQEMILQCEKMLPYWNTVRFSQQVEKETRESFVLD